MFLGRLLSKTNNNKQIGSSNLIKEIYLEINTWKMCVDLFKGASLSLMQPKSIRKMSTFQYSRKHPIFFKCSCYRKLYSY